MGLCKVKDNLGFDVGNILTGNRIVYAILGVILGSSLLYIKRKRARRKAWINRYEQDNQVKAMSVEENSKQNVIEKNNIFLKIQMYIISLWLLFVLIIPITWKMVSLEELAIARGMRAKVVLVCQQNILPIICVLMVLIGIVLFKALEYRWNGTRHLPVEVTAVESENFEYLTFLTTYIIPLVCINLDEIRYVFVLFILLIIIGIIFVRSDFYLGNPTLALMNYKLYRIHYCSEEKDCERMVITRDKIQAGDFIEAIPFDQHTWYIRRSD